MTPATRLLEALRDALTHDGAPDICDACKDPESMCAEFDECDCPLDPSCHTVRVRWVNERRDALLADIESVRALYPAAHAIGERVSVRDWLNLRTPDGPSELDFTGEVVGVQFIDGKVLYVVDAGAGLFASGRQVVDSAFVHPAPDTMMCMDCGARGLTDLRKHDAECPRPGERPTEAPPPMPFHNLVDDPPTTTLIEPSSETGSLAEALAAGDVAPFRGRHYLGTGPQSPGAITVPEESPTSSIADIQKTTFDPAVHGNTFGCLRLGGHIFDRCQRAADHEGPCVPASKPCPDCGTPPSRPHQPGCPTAAKQW